MFGYRLNKITRLTVYSQVFKDATTFFSRSSANLANVIPAMDRVDQVLATHSLDPTLNVAIRSACRLAKATMNRYYNKTDHSENFRIAMRKFSSFFITQLLTRTFAVLHPRYKTAYFKTAGWDEDWINTAIDVATTVFGLKYASREIHPASVPAVSMNVGMASGESRQVRPYSLSK
jgi:hypothetical protein